MKPFIHLCDGKPRLVKPDQSMETGKQNKLVVKFSLFLDVLHWRQSREILVLLHPD